MAACSAAARSPTSAFPCWIVISLRKRCEEPPALILPSPAVQLQVVAVGTTGLKQLVKHFGDGILLQVCVLDRLTVCVTAAAA